ncbi:MAG: permease [Candidatus Aenigmarchaeota archaeon]|nr:permease [Candidatus Aenigmarchaeota archaeon]
MDIFWPVQTFADIVTYDMLKIVQGSFLANAVNFFVYDIIKIGLLLLVINYVMAIVRYNFPMKKVKDILTKRRWYGLDYLFAALLGMVTPFCSCSSIPLFIGFVGAGIPLGVTFAFLISSPLINEASLYLFPAMFGWNVTILYNAMGLIVAMAGGMIIQRSRLDKYVKPELLKFKSREEVEDEHGGNPLPLMELLSCWWADGWGITKQVFPYVVLGVGIGALIHGYVPESLVAQYLSSKEWWAVPLAVLIGAPLYANSVAVIPIMQALVEKGVPFGTVMAFIVAVVTVSIPELMILKKVMRWQLIAAFVGITLMGVMIMGWVFNAIL